MTPLKVLIEKLNTSCRKAAERAGNLCIAQGHYEVDLEHLWLALLEQPQSDFCTVLRAAKIDLSHLQKDLQNEMATFETGNQRTPVFSSRLPKLFENAWLIATLDSRQTRIRSGHLMLAALTDAELLQMTLRGSKLFEAVPINELKHHFDKITAGSEEGGQAPDLAQNQDVNQTGQEQPGAPGLSKTPALDQFTIDLTMRAREGHIDPVIGRDTEIRQMIDILTRRRQNNPILTGEAGVGKTAVVEGLALKIAAGDVPPSLRPVQLRTLDLGLLQAGASVKGEFENRLKNVIAEVKKSPTPIVLFIDEAHQMIGAGGQAGQSDAANLLKPALARGELRTIAATTWSEYKQYFEKDAALARRFQVVKVDEPSEELTANMLRAMVPLMEKHFNVRVLDEAVVAASRLSHRYISGRQLPDKAVSVLDTACARVSLGRTATPAVIDDARQKLVRLNKERAAVRREVATGAPLRDRLNDLENEITALQKELEVNEARFKQESDLVEKIQQLRVELEAEELAANPDAKPDAHPASKRRESTVALNDKQKELAKLREELDVLQAGMPLILPHVDMQVIAEVIAGWTGIPLGRMADDEINTVLHLKEHLNKRIIGQDHALEAIAQRVRTSRAGLEDPNKPKGVFLFVGPSGVGKTETALALADILYGGEGKMVTINMSEYQESHTVSGLKGSPAGYVGYGQGGILTEAVRRQPYSVVLLDEVEKAHPDVLELFFQVFDKGQMDDAEGREIDFRNTLIILTSNVGSSTIMQECLSKPLEERPGADELQEKLAPALYKTFKPAFLGRLKTVPYYPIDDDSLVRIIELKLGRIADRVRTNHQAEFEWDKKLVDAVFARCTEVDSGARNVDHILNGTLLPEIAGEVLGRMAEDKPIAKIKVSANKSGAFTYKAM